MTNLSAKQRVEHYYDRVPDNWYVEPREASRQLFAPEKFMGPIHDPCCGSGSIVTEALPGRLRGERGRYHRSRLPRHRADRLSHGPATARQPRLQRSLHGQ